MATNFPVKIGEIGLLTYIRCLDIPKRSIAMIWLYRVKSWWTLV